MWLGLLLVLWPARGPSEPLAPQTAPRRPNILWISAEDMSPDLGCYGDAYARTPVLDGLARQGARYMSAFATAPVCAPSRSAIITGMYATTIGSMHMRSKAVPPAHVKAFPEYLRAAGYYCTNNAKTDYNFEVPPANRPPASVWDETGGAAHWRNRPDRDQPFFSVFNIMLTHEGQIRASPEQLARNTAALTPDQRHDPARATLPPYYPDTPVVRRDWANYHDSITAMDHRVGELLRQLDEDGLARDTVVFFWSDHGRGLPRAKRWVYDSGIRVPLIVRWTGVVRPGSVNDDLVSLFDLAPTALSIAGVPVPPHMQAQAFLGPQAKPPRPLVFSHRDRMDEAHDMIRSVRDKRYHYIRNFFPGRPYAQHIEYMEEMPTMKEMRRLYKEHTNALSPSYGSAMTPAQLLFFRPEKPAEELYDTRADPHEIADLAASPSSRDVLERMRTALERWQQETGDLGLVPELELRERMRPGGVWRIVEAPSISEARSGDRVTLEVTSATEGASIVYTTGTGSEARWRLYIGPVRVGPPGVIRFKACRLGYRDSEEVKRQYRVSRSCRSPGQATRRNRGLWRSGAAGRCASALDELRNRRTRCATRGFQRRSPAWTREAIHTPTDQVGDRPQAGRPRPSCGIRHRPVARCCDPV